MTDALGSVLSTFSNTAGAAALLGRQLYGPYGNQRYTNGNMDTTKGFTGQYSDAVTGLDYYGSRYYDPVAGVFLSPDSTEGNVAGMNPYGYVGGNPETWTDPSGQMVWCGPGGCGGSSGGSGSLGGGSSGSGTGTGSNTNPASWQPGPSSSNPASWQPGTCTQVGGCKLSAQTHEPTLTPVDVNSGGYQQGAPVCMFLGLCVVIPAPGGFHVRILVQTSQTGLVQICTGTFVCLDEGGGEAGATSEAENGQTDGALGGDRWYADSPTAGDNAGGGPEESPGEAEAVKGNDIPWSSKSVQRAAAALAVGDTQVTVANRSEAEELYLGIYQGEGYVNTTDLSGPEVKDLFGSKYGTYHWDDNLGPEGWLLGHGVDNPHGNLPHLQIHPFANEVNRSIIRIFYFPE